MAKKKNEAVPVYTVHYVPGSYELIGTVSAKMAGLFKGEIGDMEPLGKEGAKVGADAVIGVNVISKASSGGWDSNVFVMGTAIRYTDK